MNVQSVSRLRLIGGIGKMQKAPCKNCGDRVVGCHEGCQRYKEFVEEKRKNEEMIRNVKKQYYHERRDFY